MSKSKTLTIKQWRPDADEMASWWQLYHAAARLDSRFHGSALQRVSDELAGTQISRAQKLFIFRAWRLLVDEDALARLLGSYLTWVETVQDPKLPYVAYRPDLVEQIEAGGLGIVLEEAYEEARAELDQVNANLSAAGTLDEELLNVMRKYGWNVDRKNAAPVLELVLHKLKAYEALGESMSRYLHDPETWLIDSALVPFVRHDTEDDDCD